MTGPRLPMTKGGDRRAPGPADRVRPADRPETLEDL